MGPPPRRPCVSRRAREPPSLPVGKRRRGEARQRGSEERSEGSGALTQRPGRPFPVVAVAAARCDARPAGGCLERRQALRHAALSSPLRLSFSLSLSLSLYCVRKIPPRPSFLLFSLLSLSSSWAVCPRSLLFRRRPPHCPEHRLPIARTHELQRRVVCARAPLDGGEGAWQADNPGRGRRRVAQRRPGERRSVCAPRSADRRRRRQRHRREREGGRGRSHGRRSLFLSLSLSLFGRPSAVAQAARGKEEEGQRRERPQRGRCTGESTTETQEE